MTPNLQEALGVTGIEVSPLLHFDYFFKVIHLVTYHMRCDNKSIYYSIWNALSEYNGNISMSNIGMSERMIAFRTFLKTVTKQKFFQTMADLK